MYKNENATSAESLVSDLFNLYSSKGNFTLTQLQKIYANTVVFEDPLHKVEGIHALLDYLNEMYTRVDECRFEKLGSWVCGDVVFVQWKMFLCHPRLNGGKLFEVNGLSQLQCGDRIFYHRDYFDAGQLLYEQVPLLGSVVRWIKKRIAA